MGNNIATSELAFNPDSIKAGLISFQLGLINHFSPYGTADHAALEKIIRTGTLKDVVSFARDNFIYLPQADKERDGLTKCSYLLNEKENSKIYLLDRKYPYLCPQYGFTEILQSSKDKNDIAAVKSVEFFANDLFSCSYKTLQSITLGEISDNGQQIYSTASLKEEKNLHLLELR